MSDGGHIYDDRGLCREPSEAYQTIASTSLNVHHVAFGSGDRIGFSIDMDEGTMRYYRNGAFLAGSNITGIQVDQPLYPIACFPELHFPQDPAQVATSVCINVPDQLPDGV